MVSMARTARRGFISASATAVAVSSNVLSMARESARPVRKRTMSTS